MTGKLEIAASVDAGFGKRLTLHMAMGASSISGQWAAASTRLAGAHTAHFQAGELMKLARSVPKWAQKVFGKEFEKWLGSHERSLGRAR